MRSFRLALLAGALPASLLGGAANAQDARGINPDTPGYLRPERADAPITVTARRREETLQKVPLAVSVLTDKSLSNTGSFNVLRLTQLQPSLQLYSTNPRNTTLNIRGLGSPFGLTNDGIEQGVGIYVDEVYNARVAASTFDFVDLERIEVLRGPQGSLYGKNTTAGALNITSRAPTFKPTARGEASIGNLGYAQAKATVSTGLSDTVAVRISSGITTREGTIRNVATGKDVNSIDNQTVRGQLLWKASDRLSFTLFGDYNHQNPDCCAQIYVRVGRTQRPLNRQYDALAAAFGYTPPSKDPFDRVTDLDTELKARQEIGGVALRARWDVGPGTLTSISAWRFWNWNPSNDRDFTGLPITTVSANPSRQRQYSQELRYAGTSGRLDYVGGLFAFHQKIDTSGLQVQGPAASRFLLNPTSANASNPAVLNGLTSVNDIHFSNTSLAAFGQLTWNVTDRLKLQPGLRLNYDRKRGDYEATVFTGTGSTTLNSDQRGVLAPQSYQPKFSKWNVSGDFTASFQATPSVLAYATYARNFKSGGVNLNGLPLDAQNNPILATGSVKQETVNHYEAGLKTQLFDKRATLNVAAFWTDIKNYQATVTNGQQGVLRGYLANADKVRVRGVEVDFAARPTDFLSVYANGAFNDAKYKRFVDAPCPPELSGGRALATAPAGTQPSAPGTPNGFSPDACDISGQRLPGVSRWSVSYGAELLIPARIAGYDGNAYVGVDASYRSRFSSNPSPSAYTYIGDYSIVNFRVGYRPSPGWDVSAWVRNAFGKDYFEVLALQSGNTGLVVGQPADPRTYGGTIRFQF